MIRFIRICECMLILDNLQQRTRPRRHVEAIDFGPEYGPDIYDHDDHPPPPYTP